MRFIVYCLSLFLTTAVYADPVKLYDIINVSGVEFIPGPDETIPQCQEFSKISSIIKSSKLIDFDDKDKIDCTAYTKNDATCGLKVTLNAQGLPQIEPFGNCHLAAKPQKETQRIDRIYIGLA